MLSAAPAGAELAQLGVRNMYVSDVETRVMVGLEDLIQIQLPRSDFAGERVLVRLGRDERPLSVFESYRTDAQFPELRSQLRVCRIQSQTRVRSDQVRLFRQAR